MNPLEEDLVGLKSLADNPRVEESVRRDAQLLIAELERGSLRIKLIAKQAKKLGVDCWCRRLSDKWLADLVADSVAAEQPFFYAAAFRTVYQSYKENDRAWDAEFFRTIQDLFDLISVALVNELARRQRKRESRDGFEMRKLLVEPSERDELLLKLGELAAEDRWLFENSEEGRREAQSVAQEKIWDSLSEFSPASLAAGNPKAVLAFIQGGLNGLFNQAHERVRTVMETERRRSSTMISVERRPASGDAQDGMTPLVERLPTQADESETLRRRLLVEQVMNKAGLSEVESKAVRLHYFEGHTQATAATSLAVSQSQVSKTLQSACDKMREVLVSQ